MKRADSHSRRRLMKWTSKNWHIIHPIAGWSKAEVLGYLRSQNIPIPAGSGSQTSGIELAVSELVWLYKTYPKDYRRVCKFFPFASSGERNSMATTKLKKEKATKPPKPAAPDFQAEAFTMQKVHRSKIINADYNPRLISDAEKRKLGAGLKKHKLVAPLTWNAQTGNLVGGHQRISQLDALAGTADYELNVATINVPLDQEKEINILLNNAEAQGSWDIAKLGTLVKEKSFDVAGAGFDAADIYRLFGESMQGIAQDDPLDELAAKLSGLRESFDRMEKGNGAHDEFYVVVVFRDGPSRDAFLSKHGLPDNRYQSAEDFDELLAPKMPSER